MAINALVGHQPHQGVEQLPIGNALLVGRHGRGPWRLGGGKYRLAPGAHQQKGQRDHHCGENGMVRGGDNARRAVAGHDKLQHRIDRGIDRGRDHDKYPQAPTVLDQVGRPGRNGLADRKPHESQRNHRHCNGENSWVRRPRRRQHQTIDQT